MKVALGLAVAALACIQITSARNIFGGKDLSSPHIINGKEVEPHSHPHQVYLQQRHGFSYGTCGGSLISDSWVVTAAHCAYDVTSMKIGVGSHDKRRVTYVQVEKIFVHPQYDPSRLRNDIALVKLHHSVNLDGKTTKAIRLPSISQKNNSFYNYLATATGWGRTKTDDYDSKPDILRSVSSTVVSNFFCKASFFFLFATDSNICTSGWGNKGVCNGDSGGPLIIQEDDGQPTLVGIASFVINYGCERSWPSAFTRVTSYLDWIHDTTGIAPRM